MAGIKNKTKTTDKTTFHQHLILNQWLLSLFYKKDLAALKAQLGGDEYEGLAQDEQTKFFYQLKNILFFDNDSALLEKDLSRYDLNVVRHWQAITQKRNELSGYELNMKYFQYLSLIFTEIYLDWYVNKKADLQAALNAQMQKYQESLGKQAKHFAPYRLDELHKIAFWNATGSGKTLLMHVNILQYLHYVKNNMPDNIIVLTPNEGLSKQHVAELTLSGFQAALFDKNSSQKSLPLNFTNICAKNIEVIEVTRLAEKSGDKTVAVDHFTGNNLVLVDEGHRGTSGEEWLKRREALVKRGFSFEYSATLGQAAGKSKMLNEVHEDLMKKKAKALFDKASLKELNAEQLAQLALSPEDKQATRYKAVLETYAKTVLFDYSYKFFYADGYGKESLILNLKKDSDYFAQHEKLYYTACLLSFYQQVYLFEKHSGCLKDWHIEKPLMIFVGNTVSGEESDVLKIVDFWAYFLNNPHQIQTYLQDLIRDKAVLVDNKDRNIFLQRFSPLMSFVGKEADLYADILKRVFNADSPARLQLKLLKKADGELALSVGSYPAFGVINVGKASDLAKAAGEKMTFDTSSDEFSGSLFDTINKKSSQVNILIGSKKFTEGWSSWRVSTMGLLNMGKSEGSQIIQLFGRGVRLKGRAFSLKRSLPSERPQNVHLEKLETLNIFGINADYMDKFREYLIEEGVDLEEVITLNFQVRPNLPKGVKLKTLKLDEAYQGNREKSFKRTQKIDLFDVPEKWKNIRKPIAVLDCYPKILAMISKGVEIQQSNEKQKQKNVLDSRLFDWFDWNRIYAQLQQHKLLHSRNNLRLNRETIKAAAMQNNWYKLYIPASELKVVTFADVKKQEDLLLDLLLIYLDKFYDSLKAAYEGEFYREVEVDKENSSMLDSYHFEINGLAENGGEYKSKLNELKTYVESGDLAKVLGWEASSVEAICFSPHLFYPIMTLENRGDLPFSMKPLAMNEYSEIQFVKDLQKASDSGCLKTWTGGKDLYLLRNAGNKAKGLGFELAGNFYPDFLLWLVDRESGKQWLTFVDPKGLRQMTLDDAKFSLFEAVKKLEKNLKLDLTLNSFILSISPKEGLLNDGILSLYGKTEAQMKEKHILFMDNPDYLKEMFEMILL